MCTAVICVSFVLSEFLLGLNDKDKFVVVCRAVTITRMPTLVNITKIPTLFSSYLCLISNKRLAYDHRMILQKI